MEVAATTSDQSNKENTPPVPMKEEKKKKKKNFLPPVASSFKKTYRRRKLKRIPLADITNLFVDHSHQQNGDSANSTTSSQSVLVQSNSRRRGIMAVSDSTLRIGSSKSLTMGFR